MGWRRPLPSWSDWTRHDLARPIPRERLSECAALRGKAITGADRVWPALAELSVKGGRGRVEFVWEQVLAAAPEPSRRALQALVALGEGDDELVSAVLGEPIELHETLATIPLVSHATNDTWTAHRLWVDHIADAIDEESLRRGLSQAGQLLSLRDDHARAVRLQARLANTTAMLAAMRAGCLGHEPAVSYQELQKWIDLLPKDAEKSAVTFLVLAILAGHRDHSTATQLMRSAVEAFEREDDPVGELLAINKLVIMTYEGGDIGQVLSLASRVQALAAANVPGARQLLRLGEGMFFLPSVTR